MQAESKLFLKDHLSAYEIYLRSQSWRNIPLSQFEAIMRESDPGFRFESSSDYEKIDRTLALLFKDILPKVKV